MPADYARDLLAHPGGVRLLFGLARYLKSTLSWIGFGAMAIVAVLDIVENHHILSLLSLAEAGRPIDDSSIAFQEVLSSTKFSISYLSLFLFGISIPRTTKLGWALYLFLTIGNLFTAVLGYAAPAALRASLDSGRWVGFLVGLGLAFLWLRSAPED